MCLLSDNIYDYYNVSQGKITIPNVDDGEECQLTDVSNLGKNPANHKDLKKIICSISVAQCIMGLSRHKHD